MITSLSGRQELWVLTSSFQKYMSGSLNPNETNFRIQAAYVDELVRGTKCDVTSHANTVFPRPTSIARGYKPVTFPSWRSWYREESLMSKFHQTTSSLLFHHIPPHNFDIHHDDFSFPHFYRNLPYFSRYFGYTKYFHNSYKFRPAVYSFYIDHGWEKNICCFCLFG